VELALSDELVAFRERARNFIRDRSPAMEKRPGTRTPRAEDMPAFRAWCASLFDAGFLGADWPTEWGGRPGHTPLHDFVFDGELGAARAPTPVGAWRLVANSLLLYGTPRQQEYYLPRIRSYQDFWCQLFSEPDAGSDLASLRCRAERDGDSWIINGQKVWTTHGHLADRGFLLARSDPDAAKHHGISAFIVDMRSPGIEIRPLREITGSNDFNEVFFTDVRIPDTDLIGAPGEGWAVARSSLARERSESRREESVTQSVSRLAALARRRAAPDSGLEAGGELRARVGRLYARAEISDLMSYLQLENEMAGIGEVDDAAITKVFFGELNLDIQRTAVELQGSGGLLAEGDPEAADGGWWLEGFLWARGFTISAGSNEVMRNQIAERGLGLPRD